MCGLAGFLAVRSLSSEEVNETLPRMTGALEHRGPDDQGLWHDAAAGIALGHRRLAIVDLSAAGHQPMFSSQRRFVVVYNGEIYNFRELRAELQRLGASFASGSDTEVLLAAVECWGVHEALRRFNGMFAFALWDCRERLLYLARDRFGEKPLYFGVNDGTLLFGSELKALRPHRSWSEEVDRSAIALLMRHGYIPAPFSVFRRVRKLMPGSCVTAQVRGAEIVLSEQRYWHPEALFEAAAAESSPLTPSQSLELVENALSNAIARQMVADVPVGAFLSGGTDSSLVVALMQKAATQRVKTFSMGFSEEQYNEAPFARAVAEHLGTDHTEHIVTPQDCLEVIPQLPRIYDEPFADSSQVPTYLVCRLARRDVTVALSGDAGDELFAGYGRYAMALAKWRTLQRMPAAMRMGGSALMAGLPKSAAIFGLREQRVAHRLQHYSAKLAATNLRDFYRRGLHQWHDSEPVVGDCAAANAWNGTAPARGIDDLKQMMYMDTCEYLPDDILVKVDRAAMAVSLETRVPMLDVEVAQAAWRIPGSVLMHDGRGKWVLRELLRRHIPSPLVDRPKRGFAVPVAQWLRAELRPWAAELLDSYRLRQEGYLDSVKVQARWRQHLAGEDWSAHLWAVLAFQAWLDHWRRSATGEAEQPRRRAAS